MPPPKLKVGLAGLGRMGKRHAMHFLNRTPRAELVAASTPDDVELGWARERLEPWGVTPYKSYEKMLKHPGLQAVVVASATSVHADQAIKAMATDKHVLCEKPLSTSVEVSQSVLTAAQSRPHLNVMCGFSRRFDASYRDAHRKTASGLIGTPSVFRSQTCDKLDPSGFFLKYSKHSGGIFVDCSIHDIDLAFWFFSIDTDSPPKVKSVVASGITAVEPGLQEWGDADNAVGIVEFWGGRIAYFYASRMMAAGQEDTTEIIGTKGKLTVNANPQLNLVEHHGAEGVRREVAGTYYERFEEAFVREAGEWTDGCLDGGEEVMGAGEGLEGAVEAVRVAGALQESLRTGRKIWFGEGRGRVEKGG